MSSHFTTDTINHTIEKLHIMTTQSPNVWIDKPLDGFYFHIYSNGNNVRNLFETDSDCIFGMNLLPIAAYSSNVRLLMVQVMGTHFHVIAHGRPEDCERMRRLVRRQLETRLAKTGRKEYAPSGIEISIDEIKTETELKNKIIYVYRNGIAAGFPQAPWHYPWGPGDILFVNHKMAALQGNRICDLGVRQRHTLFHSRVMLPADWRYNDSGMILPHSYLDWNRVEKLFVSIRAFLAFLHQKKDIESQIDREANATSFSRLSDKDLRKEASGLFRSLFGRDSASKATIDERMAVAQKLWVTRRTYSLPQLARVTLLDKALLSKVFGHQ